MDQRLRVGIVCLWDESWLGGVYYIRNLIFALNTLHNEKKPIVDLYCKSDAAFKSIQSETRYPYLIKNTINISIFTRLYLRVVSIFSKKAYLGINLFPINCSDTIIYPYVRGSHKDKYVYWLPDFQEKYFPEYFSDKVIKYREREIINVCKKNIPIVFSSKDCSDDFKKFYPEYQNHPVFIVHFAVSQVDFSDIDINELKNRYGINKPYLLCANQFWKHKNHKFLFDTFMLALTKGLDMQLVCTGKMEDPRDPEYISSLKKFIKSNGLEQRILTLGIIDKKELLCLMSNSYAVIQPSLFEGWNTTVEDCKAMNKFVFLSDLRVHREQISNNVCFFDPRNKEDLLNKLITVPPLINQPCNYSVNIQKFANDFLSVIESKII